VSILKLIDNKTPLYIFVNIIMILLYLIDDKTFTIFTIIPGLKPVYLYGIMVLSLELQCEVEEALVSGSNPIPDDHMTASSEWDLNHGPRFARMNNTAFPGGWLCSSAERDAPEPRMYIQVCLLATIRVKLSKTI